MYDYLTFMDDFVIAGRHQFEDLRFCISSLRESYRTGLEDIDQRHRGWNISFEFGRTGKTLTKA